ncbi:geranylgeranyl reductase family protein [Parafrankia sp. BMG5.11]|uniref:geranylgeranyl reductase family protein n=1 Tax=Parafrankia sp. BMG5.11 TaxID=222540 RepID=UPI00103B2092|nr:geranylgeranyl reductase family protein [Parafrankia sp. BMG5.11]TCJ35283.1 geranylgeranyl reductase family protein [Parafrankia sp. BMG5.11]
MPPEPPSPVFDVVVLGAGPAGTSAARAAAEAGARVCVLERMAVPRYKTCGGGLVGLSVDHAGIDLAPLVRSRVDALTMTLDGRHPVTRRSKDGRPLLSMVMRSELDAALLDSAKAAGAEVRTGVHVTGLREEGTAEPGRGEVVVQVRSGPAVRARVVVGADGTSGRAGTHVGVTCDQVDVGLEGEFEVPAPVAGEWSGRMLLDWGPVPGSYGWVFPKGDVLTVGVIGAREHGPALRRYYDALVERLGLTAAPRLHDSGHLTRVRAAGSPLRRGRVLLAGDAAGLLDPWTREGISFALRSGRLAGISAAAGAAGDPTALDRYPARIEGVFGPEIAAGRSVLAVFTRRPALMHTMMTRVPGTFGLFGRIIEGRSTIARQLRRPGMAAVIAALGR